MHWIMTKDADANKIDKLLEAILTTDLDIFIIQPDSLKEGTDKLFTTCESIYVDVQVQCCLSS